jgi:hypothetical protein
MHLPKKIHTLIKGINAFVQRNKWLIAAIVFLVVAASGIVYKSHQKGDKSATVFASQTNHCMNIDTSKDSSYDCYKQDLGMVINQSGPEQAVKVLKQQYNAVPYVKSACHQLMHIVGRGAYAKYGNLADAFAHGDQYCWSGYYHGIMEQVSKEKGYNYIIKNVNSICKPIADKYGPYSFNHFNCVHGLGHGFMMIEDENLFDALSSCDAMDGSWKQDSCFGGVFMQNVMNVQGPEGTTIANYKYLKSDQPMYPCTAVAEKYKGQCYLMQTSFALELENYDFGKVFKLCSQIESEHIETCYQSLGRDASGQSVSDLQKTKDTCLLGSTAVAQTNCIIGAVKDFVSYYHNDKPGYDLCNALTANIKKTCNTTVKSYYSTF